MNASVVSTHSHRCTHWAVLDTQAVLDWLYFDDPHTRHWEDWRNAGDWCWVAGCAMRDELAHVLGRGCLPPGRGMAADALLAAFDVRVQCLPEPAPSLAPRPRCTDPDDQKFIDFAVSHCAAWLVSRDRAVLKLRRRVLSAHGVQIVPPRDWAPLAVPA